MLKVHIILILVTIMWGINPPVMKLGLQYVPSLSYNVARLVIAFLMGFIIFRYIKPWNKFDKDSLRGLIIASLGFCVFQVFFTFGVKLTTAGNASLLIGCLPVSVSVINHLHHIETINKYILRGVFLSIIGVFIMVLGTGSEISFGSNHMAGAVLLVIAQFGYGYYTVFSKPLTKFYSPYQIAVYMLLVSMVVFAVISLPEMIHTDWRNIQLPGWLSILYSAIFPLCLANCLWISSVDKVGSTIAAMYNNLSPFFAIIAGYFLLGETFNLLQIIGAVIIITGLYITKNNKPRHEVAGTEG